VKFKCPPKERALFTLDRHRPSHGRTYPGAFNRRNASEEYGLEVHYGQPIIAELPSFLLRGLNMTLRSGVTEVSCTSGSLRSPFLFQAILLVGLSAAKTTLGASPQESEKKTPRLRWDPPHVDARLQLQPAPPCSLPEF
jgi:hypothetical protein